MKITGKGLDSIYDNPINKVWKGTINWYFHMISDMVGSSGTIKDGGYGTGLPGPVLSFLKEISSNEKIRKLAGKAGNTDRDNFSVMVQNLFSGRLLADHDANGKVIKGTEIPFDLRTEIGLGHELTKQTRQSLCICLPMLFPPLRYSPAKALVPINKTVSRLL